MTACRTVAVFVVALGWSLGATAPAPTRVGLQPDGSVLLPTGWKLAPAGQQIPTSTLPTTAVVSPEGEFLVVLHSGCLPPTVVVFDLSSLKPVAEAEVEGAWRGLAFSPENKLLYVSGGASGRVYEFALQRGGQLERRRVFNLDPESGSSERPFLGDLAFSPDGRLLYVTSLSTNQVIVVNPRSGWVVDRFRTARQPYALLFDSKGEWFFVTSWSESSLHRHRASDGAHLEQLRLARQPMGMALSRFRPPGSEAEPAAEWAMRLFVAVSNTNRIYVVGVSDTGTLTLAETVQVSPWPWQPPGMLPTAVASSPDGKLIYVVCSGGNAVAVLDVSEKRSRVAGYIPTGWFPTQVVPLADGRLVVLNGKGLGSAPNPNGPSPLREPQAPQQALSHDGFVGRLLRGSLSVIPPVEPNRLFQWTRQVLRNSPYSDQKLAQVEIPEGNPIPPGSKVPPERTSPIRHVLFIIKENRTYDEIFGDIREGNGDPSLAIFGEAVTPNHHKLAREFVLFDNFYACGAVDADGWNWTTGAIAPAYVELLWPSVYSGRRKQYDFFGQALPSIPPAAYLWTNAAAAKRSLRNYGLLVENLAAKELGQIQVKAVRDPVLRGVTNLYFRGFDLDYPDVERAKVFIEDLRQMEQRGEMPQLVLMHLGNDHTAGTMPGKIAPRSAVADNDLALGMIVEACSRSRFWRQMAIFVVEDDAHGGSDHVDAHRTVALVISPYARRKTVDSTFYNTVSMLRTIELILGLNPMSHYDAGAMPMWTAFTSTPNFQPYTAEPARVPLDERNP